jgi:eukaryotic-like serine/threonine-protein kinase
MYSGRNEYDKAIEEYRLAIALAPDEPLPLGNLAGIYRTLNRPDDARRLLEDGIKRGVDSIGFRSELYTLAFLRNDDAEMSHQLEAARRFSDGSVRMLTTQLGLALYEGRLARAQELAAQYALEAGSTLGLKGSAASAWSNVAQSAAAFGDTQSARAAVRNSLNLERNLGSVLNSAIATVVSGDAQAARKLLDEAARMPGAANDDAQRGFKFADGLIRWRQGDKGAADALPVPTDASDTGATFMLGVVQLANGRAEDAAARFKQILDRKQLTIHPLKSIAALYYGRALVKMGKVEEGRQSYEQFFEEWKKADAALPVLVEAKKEYARLKITD